MENLKEAIKNLSDDKLNQYRNILDAYLQGCSDTFEIIEDTHKKTTDFYNKKIKEVDDELSRRE